MSKVIRSVKNVTKGYSATQIKVRNATSNDPWGPTGTDMSDIARMTFDTNHDFFEIMEMLDRRLNDKGKNWRHVLKALKVLDYCLHEGSAHVVVWAKDNIYIIKTLREFQYIDEEGKDQGLNVRVAAKELTGLILDEERLRSERKDRKSWKSRVMGLEEGISSDGPQPEARSTRRQMRQQRPDEEDLEYKLAIEASKNLAEEEAAKKQKGNPYETDADLEKALKLSQEEEELRQKELESANEESLFDDIPVAQNNQANFQQGGFAQPQQWQQGGAVDLFGNPIQQQPTGFLQNVYAQPGFDQNQFGGQQQGGFQPQIAQPTGYGQQQPFGADAFGQQQQQQQQQPFLQTQPTSFSPANPYSANTFSPQQTSLQQPADHNPYGLQAQQQQQPQESLKPMPTGSNNPFAQFASPSSGFGVASPRQQGPPTLNQLGQSLPSGPARQQTPSQQPVALPSPPTNYASAFQPQQTPMDSKHAQLNALLASGEGQDTFGNTGNLRIPAQHTAPGTFINSAGTGRTGMQAQATGNNPFFNNQFTGVPQPQYGSSLAPQTNRMQPAATGPADMQAYGAPFGQQQQQLQYGQQQQQQPFGFGQQNPQQTSNLIDF